MSRCVAGARQAPGPFCGYFLVVESEKVERGVRYQNTVLGELLKVVSRRHFGAIVSRHEGDRYIKDFSSWDHLVSLVFAQLGGLSSLREVAAVWNAQGAHHYHLGSGPVCRSTCPTPIGGGQARSSPKRLALSQSLPAARCATLASKSCG